MADTSARMLRLLSLLQSKRDWTGAELSGRLGVSVRTTRRDIETLRELGYPVNVTRGPGGAYRLGAGASLPPLILDDEQAVAVTVALQTAPATVLGVNEAAARALETIRQVLPSRLRHQVDSMQVTFITNAWELAAPAIDPQVLLAVSAAMRAQEVLRFDYRPAAQDTPAVQPVPLRRIEPHHLVAWSGRWYLVAFDLDHDAWKTFRIDRMSPRTPTGPRFRPRSLPNANVAEYVKTDTDRGDTPDHWPCTGSAILHAPPSLVARWAPGGAVVEDVTATSCKITMGAWSWIGLAALLGTFASDIDIIGPDELRAACRTLAERYETASSTAPPA